MGTAACWAGALLALGGCCFTPLGPGDGGGLIGCNRPDTGGCHDFQYLDAGQDGGAQDSGMPVPTCGDCPSPGATRCLGNDVQSCQIEISVPCRGCLEQSCLKWVAPTPCPSGQTCDNEGRACIALGSSCTVDGPCACGCGCDGSSGKCDLCGGAIPPTCATATDCGPVCAGFQCKGGQCVQSPTWLDGGFVGSWAGSGAWSENDGAGGGGGGSLSETETLVAGSSGEVVFQNFLTDGLGLFHCDLPWNASGQSASVVAGSTCQSLSGQTFTFQGGSALVNGNAMSLSANGLGGGGSFQVEEELDRQ